jgi:hypothetical protein
MSEDRMRNELFELYKISIETDRFELELGWKLVQFFTVLDSGLLSLGFIFLLIGQTSSQPSQAWRTQSNAYKIVYL